jgi:molybdopterin-guanine dinucleotide biosynthesis protein B
VATDTPAALPVPHGALPVLPLNSPAVVAERLLAWGERFNYAGDRHG